MNKINSADRNVLNQQNTINLIIVIFVCLIVSASIFIGRGFSWSRVSVEVGHISQQDIYAPFEFSFIDINGQEISVKKDELIVQRGQRINQTQQIAASELKKIQRQPKNLYYILGILLLMIIFTVITVTYQTVRRLKVLLKLKNVVLLCCVSLLIVLGAKQ